MELLELGVSRNFKLYWIGADISIFLQVCGDNWVCLYLVGWMWAWLLIVFL